MQHFVATHNIASQEHLTMYLLNVRQIYFVPSKFPSQNVMTYTESLKVTSVQSFVKMLQVVLIPINLSFGNASEMKHGNLSVIQWSVSHMMVLIWV